MKIYQLMALVFISIAANEAAYILGWYQMSETWGEWSFSVVSTAVIVGCVFAIEIGVGGMAKRRKAKAAKKDRLKNLGF